MIKFKYLKNALVLTMLVLSPFTVKAQEISQNTDTDTENGTGAVSDSDVYDNEISKKLDSLLYTVEKQQEQLVSQQKQYDEFKHEMETRLDEAQNERDDFQTQLLSVDEGDDKQLSIYGFMDFSFIKSFPSNKESVIYTSVPYNSTFAVGNVNLFVKSNPAPTIEALIETRLTFQPNGEIEQMPTVAYLGGKEAYSYGEFERVSTDVSDGKG
ncbi:MAG: hypothetical protein JXR91_16755, partial [Deltaproteobacteria bacterium]|nr:hypothetical protein [Deltaproteobacteria bacterium]